MQEEEQRARLVKGATAFLEDTPLSPDTYERHLLGRFVAGELTIYQVLEMLATHNEAMQSVAPSSRDTEK